MANKFSLQLQLKLFVHRLPRKVQIPSPSVTNVNDW